MAKITIQRGATQQTRSNGSLSSTSRMTQRIAARPTTQRRSTTSSRQTNSREDTSRSKKKKQTGPPVALWVSLGVVGFIILICIIVAAANKGPARPAYNPYARTSSGTRQPTKRGNWDNSMGEWMKNRPPTELAKQRKSHRSSGYRR